MTCAWCWLCNQRRKSFKSVSCRGPRSIQIEISELDKTCSLLLSKPPFISPWIRPPSCPVPHFPPFSLSPLFHGYSSFLAFHTLQIRQKKLTGQRGGVDAGGGSPLSPSSGPVLNQLLLPLTPIWEKQERIQPASRFITELL